MSSSLTCIGNFGFGGKTWPPTAHVWQYHLRADGLIPEISTWPYARSLVRANLFAFFISFAR